MLLPKPGLYLRTLCVCTSINIAVYDPDRAENTVSGNRAPKSIPIIPRALIHLPVSKKFLEKSGLPSSFPERVKPGYKSEMCEQNINNRICKHCSNSLSWEMNYLKPSKYSKKFRIYQCVYKVLKLVTLITLLNFFHKRGNWNYKPELTKSKYKTLFLDHSNNYSANVLKLDDL